VTEERPKQTPFDWWMNHVFPLIKIRYAAVPAKSRIFYDEKGSLIKTDDSSAIDQSMLTHVFNAVSAAHRMIDVLRLRENKIITEKDEAILYAELTVHDMHKLERDPATHATYGHVISLDDYEKLLRDFHYDPESLPRSTIEAKIAPTIDHHHPVKNNVTEQMYANPATVLYDRDITYHLLLLGDRIASAKGVEDAISSIEDTLKTMKAKVSSCKSLSWHLSYHETGAFDGDFISTLHQITEAELKNRKWLPVLFFPDGTIYLSSEAVEIDAEQVYSAIASNLDTYLSDDTVQFAIQLNMAKIKTKNYWEKAHPRKTLTLLTKVFKRTNLEKIFGRISAKFDERQKAEAAWGAQYAAIKYDMFAHAVFLYISAVEDMYVDFGFISNYERMSYAEKDRAISMLFTGRDLSSDMQKFQILDASQSRNPSSTPGHLIPLAKAVRDAIYAPGMAMNDFLDALFNMTCRILAASNEVLFEGREFDSLALKLLPIIRSEIGFNRLPLPREDADFGLSAYTNALEKAPGKFDAKCFLCSATSDLEPVNPNLVRMGLQIHSDRVPSGKSISASQVKKICLRCWVKITIRNKKYPWISDGDADQTFYITVTPNHVFTRDHEQWIIPYISGLFTLSRDSYKKIMTLADEEVRMAIENELKLYTFVINRIVTDLVYVASSEGKMDSMHELIAGAVERSCAMNRLVDEFGEIGGVNIEAERQDIIGSRYMQLNGFVVPFKFIEKDTNPTSMWLIASAIAALVSLVTGARVSVTQDYGNIPLVTSNSIVTMDAPPPLVNRLVGSEIGLGAGELIAKLLLMIFVIYINFKAIRPDAAKDNTIPTVIDQFIRSPLKMIDWCWRYLEKSEAKRMSEFYQLFKVIDKLLEITR